MLPGVSKRFVQVEDEACAAAFGEADIEAEVDARFELPAVSDAGVGQEVTPLELLPTAEGFGESDPGHCSVAPLDVLSEFQLRLDEVLVTVASFIVSAHSVIPAHFAEQCPRCVAAVEHAVEVVGKDAAFPDFLVG